MALNEAGDQSLCCLRKMGAMPVVVMKSLVASFDRVSVPNRHMYVLLVSKGAKNMK